VAVDQDVVDPARPPGQFAQVCRVDRKVAGRVRVVPARIEESVKRVWVRHSVEIAKEDAGTGARDRLREAIPNCREHRPHGCQVHVGGCDDDGRPKATVAQEAPQQESGHDVSPAD
jgi:hypothetical protein